MSKITNNAAYIKMIIAVLLWGGVYHVAGNLVHEFDPVGNSAIRWCIASTIFSIILIRKTGLHEFKQSLSNWILLFWGGVFSVTLYMTFFFYAERLVSGNLIAILYAFTPCLAFLLNALLGRSKLNLGILLGIIIALVGTVFVINFSNKDCGKFFCKAMIGSMSLGHYVAMSLGLFTAIYTILVDKAIKRGIKSMTVLTLSSLMASVTLLIISIFTTNYSQIANLSITYWLSMLYVSILGTVIPFMFYTQVVAVLGVERTAVFQNGVPFATVAIGAIFYGKYISIWVLFSSLIVVIGVIVANYYGNKAKAMHSIPKKYK